jgi:hypothetical protein
MGMHYATIYPEGEEWRRVHAESWMAMRLLTFWIGLKTFWPNPLNARRVVVERPGWEWQTFLHD